MDEQYLNHVTEEDITAAKDKHGDEPLQLLEFTMDDGKIFEGIFAVPTTASFQRYLQTVNDAKRKNASITASQTYVKDNMVAPAWDDFYEMTKDRPALPVMIANELAQGKGLVRNTEKKML